MYETYFNLVVPIAQVMALVDYLGMIPSLSFELSAACSLSTQLMEYSNMRDKEGDPYIKLEVSSLQQRMIT